METEVLFQQIYCFDNYYWRKCKMWTNISINVVKA